MEEKIILRLSFGDGGHENEYIIDRLDDLSELSYLPQQMRILRQFNHFNETIFRKIMPNYEVNNRGSRIEIKGQRNDDLILEKIKEFYNSIGKNPRIVLI